MRTAIGFMIGCVMTYGVLTREPMIALVMSLALLLALAAEFMEDQE